MQTVREIIIKHGNVNQEDLIPLLQEIQGEHGYLSRSAMEEVANTLRIPVCRIYGVATFYNQFRFAPVGQNVIEVCRGTACHVKGSSPLADYLKRRLKVSQDGNSPDGKFTLITVACLGACSIAPVMKMNGEFYGHLTAEHIEKILSEEAK